MVPDDDVEIDRLITEYDQFLEKQRNDVGLDELVKIARFTPEEDRFIEGILLHPQLNESGDRPQFRKILVRLLLVILHLHQEILNLKRGDEQKQKQFKFNRSLVVQFCLVSAAIIGFLTFHHIEITLDPSDDSAIAIETSWWGIVKKQREIKWMTTADAEDPGWMTKGEDGKWYPFLLENETIEE